MEFPRGSSHDCRRLRDVHGLVKKVLGKREIKMIIKKISCESVLKHKFGFSVITWLQLGGREASW